MRKLILIAFIVFVANAKAQIISTVAGNGASGYFGDGGAATAAVLNRPYGLTFDVAGNMYIADYSNYCVRKVNTAGVISTFASGVGVASGVAFDVFGNLYITDLSDNFVRKVNTAGIISTFAGNGTGSFSGDGGAAIAAEVHGTSAVACDVAGNVYIADYYNSRIRRVNTSGIISTFAGNGLSGYTGDGGAATAATLGTPQGLCFDASGNLYIADQNNCIRKVILSTGIITTYAGNGATGYAGDGGQATAASLSNPYGISFDAVGNLYITETNSSNRIRRVNTAGIISTAVGNGTAAYSGDGGPATAAELNHPNGVGFDALGNLYIADGSNSRIRKVTCTPVVNISGLNSVCPGGGTMLSAGGADTYVWSSNAGGVQTNTVSVSPTATTVYSVTGTSIFGCTATQTISVHINSLPIVSIGGNSSICIGAHTILTGMGANTYTWNSGSNTNAISVNPISNTTYTVTGTDGNGCANSDTITVVVNPLPVITANSGTICAGQSFTITPSGATTYTYSSGSDVVTPTVNTTYTVNGTDGNGCKNNAAVTCSVTVNALPIISANSATVCAGVMATLTASGANTYTWNTGATGASISPSPTVTTSYSVSGTNNIDGCTGVTTTSITVYLLPPPTVMSNTPCANQTLNLSCTPNGMISYNWTGPNSFSSSQQNPTITGTQTSSVGVYSVTTVNAFSCISSGTVSVVINPLPVVTVTGATVCLGQTINLGCTPNGDIYSWSGPGGYTSNLQSPSIPNASLSMSGNFVVTVTDANGCANANATEVVVNPSPIVYIGGDTIVCSGSTTTLTAGGTTTYTWNTGAHTPSIIALTSGAYTVTGTDINGCSGTASTNVSFVACAGIEQVTGINNQVNIYPNPNNGSFVIEPQNTLHNVPCTMYDVNGKMVLSQIINGKTNIDASTLNEGVYNISLISNEGIVNKRLVIVR